ncbi:hypothetical protein HO173_001636 [Letharia columbiana]|uniref:Uncharacterized protein n=1 Tax=Letharia columbiana TaxID=112416 RepID=A0A8H6L919_9LECA|nr:uncharacterized protein HO173_001636 [Letharia columbiana]KAF6240026.1 hypothetical protein HO173_001636 [Letharia columbiana]
MDDYSSPRQTFIPLLSSCLTQEEISQLINSILALDPKRSTEEVQYAATLQVLAPALERLLVTTQEESDKEHGTALRDIQLEASKRTRSIFANHQRLGSIFAEHGRDLKHRWGNRNPDRRRKLLLTAWPDIPLVHRPDFDALRQQRSLWSLERKRDGTKHKNAYLMPHINVEDLGKSKNLLLFIESRTRNDPEAFAWSDSLQIRMAASADAVKIMTCTGYTMMLSGQMTQEAYGDIVSWKGDSSSIQSLLMGTGFNPSEGLIVLEIQDRTLQFLITCTDLMRGVKAGATIDRAQAAPTAGTDAQAQEAEASVKPIHAGLIIDDETSPSESTVEVNTKAPYRQPQHFSLEYLRKLATAKKDEAEDEIWALREDPSYFQNVLQHRYQMTLYVFERVYSEDVTTLKGKILQTACGNIIHAAYKYLIIWDIILEDLQKLERLHIGIATSPVEPLPDKYQEALASFVLVIDKLTKYPLEDLRKVLPMSEPIREYFDRTRKNDGSIAYLPRKDMEIPPIIGMVYDLMNPERTALMGVPNILDDVERIMRKDKRQKGLITTEVAKTLSETAALGEIHARLSCHQPRIQLPMDLDSFLADVESRIGIIAMIQKQMEGVSLDQFVTPAQDFDYPANARRTQKTIDRLRAEETMLDTFWQQVDQHFTKTCGKTLNGFMGDRISERKIERTGTWQSAVVRPKQKKKATPHTTPEEIEALRTFQTEAESSTPLAARPKEKVKTRGVANPPPDLGAAGEPEAEVTAEPQAQVFELAKAPYKTMRKFFPADVQDRIGAKVSWKDFVSAMQKLDFSIKSLDGSASLFEPAWKPESSIIFHEPHPGNEIRFDLLRRYSGRLFRKYGWTTETFVQG